MRIEYFEEYNDAMACSARAKCAGQASFMGMRNGFFEVHIYGSNDRVHAQAVAAFNAIKLHDKED